VSKRIFKQRLVDFICMTLLSCSFIITVAYLETMKRGCQSERLMRTYYSVSKSLRSLPNFD